mgnify:CR=1 FL=1
MLDNEVELKEKKTTEVYFNHIVLDKLKQKYIAFDTETTGFSFTNDRIIELGAVLFENGKITKRFGTLVNAKINISPEVSLINHITNDMISSAPSEKEAYEKFIEFLDDALDGNTIICAHNAKFDMGFLTETFKRLGISANIKYIDTLYLSRKLVKGLYNYKQDTVAKHFGIINKESHRAVTDAETCGKILWNLLQLK